MEWFRFYAETLDNPKVQQLPGDAVKGWLNLLCLANSGDGVLPPLRTIAFRLRISEEEALRLLEQLMDEGLIDQREGYLEMHDWNEFQRSGDDSAPRARRYRENQKSKLISQATGETRAKVDVTLPSRDASRDRHALETEQSRAETEENREETISAPQAPLKSSHRPKLSEAQLRIQETVASVAAHIKTRHPEVRNGMGATAIGNKLQSILRRHSINSDKAIEFLTALDTRHESWCATEQWTENGGVYAKAIANWLSPSQDRYLEDPPAVSASASRHSEKTATRFPRDIYGEPTPMKRTPEEIAMLHEQAKDESPAIRRAAQARLAEYQSQEPSWKN
jgi:DNA-binding Lrp family transcriptional regulator